MTFTPKDWQDEPSTATPITSAELERIEAGVVEALQTANETQRGPVELASPAEMTTGTDLTRVPAVKRVADYVAAQISAAIAALPSASAASETAAGIVELASPAEMTAGTDLTRAPAVKRVADYVTAAVGALSTSTTNAINALSASTTTALGGKADKSGSWQVFSDVSDVPFTDGDVPIYDNSSNALEPTDVSVRFAGLDANLRLDSANFPQFYIPQIIINEGDTPPGTFPAYGLVGKLPAAASLIPTLIDVQSVRAASAVTLTLPQAIPSGTVIGFSIGFDNTTAPDHFSGAFGGTGAGAGVFDFGTMSLPNTTAGVLNGFVKLTANASAASTITFTVRDASNVAFNKTHIIAAAYILPNLVSTSQRDQQGVGGGSSSATLTAITAAITVDTTQPSEIIIGSACNSAGTAPNTRDVTGTNEWAGNTIADSLSDNGTSGRRLYVGYTVLTAIGRPSLKTVVTLSGTATQTGQWAAKIDSFKGL